MSRLHSSGNSPYAFWIGSLLWLPVGIMLTTVIRFPDQLASTAGWLMLLGGLPSLIFVAPCGLPLALACRRLWLFGHREAAWATMVGLGILTVWATLGAGLLGPIAIAIYAIVLSLPAWLAVLIIGRRRTSETG